MKKIIIVGAGFAGLSALLILKKSKLDLDIKIIDKDDKFEYTPSLHECIGNPKRIKEISFSLKKYYKDHFIQDEVVKVDKQSIKTKNSNYKFDYLILATGSRTNFFRNESFQKCAFPLRRIKDVEKINKKLKQAKVITVIGGGYTGVEVASILTSKTKKKIQLIHPTLRTLDRMHEYTSRISDLYLQKHGVEIFFKEYMSKCEPNKITLKSDRVLDSDITLLTAGILPNEEIYGEKVKVNPLLASEEHNNIFLCGDVARSSLIPTAHNAMIEGRAVGKCIVDMLNKKTKTCYVTPKKNLLAVALGPMDGIITYGDRGWRFPFTGILKWLVEKRIMFELKYKIILPL